MLSIETVGYRENIDIIHPIRTRVFQLEQNIAPELEFDGLDAAATHLLAFWGDTPAGTARLRAIAPHTGKIERLAVLPEMRRRGIGRQLMQYALESFQQQGMHRVVINAQAYIAPLYEQLGFQIHGDPFEEAGIPHVYMEIALNGSYSDS
ncbi:GNAT family N-acetyltransferase [Baaleninema sp.]|uniref:GNAT family N-acetyltransferase n=1 Tax=Baaleninema sp. TaxID=3101197 RepID=UPI003D073182